MEDALRGHGTHRQPLLLRVLILVLMEDALREEVSKLNIPDISGVLILVLMEDALRVASRISECSTSIVLILVRMEDALRGQRTATTQQIEPSLNPCSNGRCSASYNKIVDNLTDLGVS